MAKLDGIKVVNENTVEYNGFVYGLVTDGGRVNDLIQCFEDGYDDLTYEAFYEVVRTNESNDMKFLDDINDDRCRDCDDGDWKVFRKSHAIINDKLTDAEGVVIITLPDGTKLEGTPSDLASVTRSMQALQAEQAVTVEMPEEAVGVEDESEPVSGRLQVGDYAKVITHDANGQSEYGDIVKVTEDDNGIIPFNTDHLDGSYAGWHYEGDLVKATDEEVLEAKQALLKEGDFARVIGNTSNHRFEIGTVVNLKGHNSDIKSFTAYYIDESDFWGVYSKDLEPLTKEETEHIAREAEEEKKAKAERAKWAAIGREVGELRKGDIVSYLRKDLLLGKVLGVNSNFSRPGDVRYYIDFGEEGFRVCTEKIDDLKLIATTESLFEQAPVTEMAEKVE